VDGELKRRKGIEDRMGADARHTIRNAGLLMAQRALHILGAALFAVTVPRLMGPSLFGRFALLMSVSMWFTVLSGLGVVSMITRCIPKFVADDDMPGLRRLLSSLLALRGLTGASSAITYFLVATLVLREPDPLAAGLAAAGVACRTVANLTYSFFLGLDRAARWGAGDLMRRLLTLMFVPLGFLAGGLRGACGGFLAAECLVLVTGLVGARHLLRWSAVDLSRQYLRPYLKTGSLFAVAGLLMALTQRSGEPMLRFSTGSYEQIGYFGAAYAIYLTGAHACWQFAIAFAPFLVTLLEQGRRREVSTWLERILKYLVVAAVLAAAGVWFLGRDLIPLVLGAKYASVAVNAVPLCFTFVSLVFVVVSRLLALILDKPTVTATSAALELTVFWAVGFPLSSSIGSLGAAWATLPASLCFAACAAWWTRRELPFPLGAPGRALALALIFVPLAFLRGSMVVDAALAAGGAAVYLVLLWRFGVVTPNEVREVRRQIASIAPRRPAAAAASE
jgi:O-antigen/teichoic acid export membrane protein